MDARHAQRCDSPTRRFFVYRDITLKNALEDSPKDTSSN